MQNDGSYTGNPPSTGTQDKYQEKTEYPTEPTDLRSEDVYPSNTVRFQKYIADLKDKTNAAESLFDATEATGDAGQGAIYKDVCSYLVSRQGNTVSLSEITYPWVIVLSQACDLERNSEARDELSKGGKKHDKILLSALVAPLFDVVQTVTGEHLEALAMQMTAIPIGVLKSITNDQRPRYHCVNNTHVTQPSKITFSRAVIDFKHFFTVPLSQLGPEKFCTNLENFYREKISQRFSAYLSRIGIPEA